MTVDVSLVAVRERERESLSLVNEKKAYLNNAKKVKNNRVVDNTALFLLHPRDG